MELDPCIACRRHVAVSEIACPFCGAVLVARAAQPIAARRLSRAAVFVAGVVIAGSGCGGSKKDVTTQPTHPIASDAGVSNPADAGAVEQVEEHRHPGGGGCNPVCMPYGAPPARRRLV